MKRAALLVGGLLCAAVLVGTAQTGLDPAKLLKPGTDSWPSYNGDYTGRRFSTLTRINDANVQALSLAWMYRVNPGTGGNPGSIKGTPLQVNGVMYLTAPDHVWALDARTGREIWHFSWQSKGGIHIGNRGAAVLGAAHVRWLLGDKAEPAAVCLDKVATATRSLTIRFARKKPFDPCGGAVWSALGVSTCQADSRPLSRLSEQQVPTLTFLAKSQAGWPIDW